MAVGGTKVNPKKFEKSQIPLYVYLLALALSGRLAQEAAAIEDSRAGLEAAKAAGLYAVGYHAPGPFAQDLSRADGEILHMTELLPLLLGEQV